MSKLLPYAAVTVALVLAACSVGPQQSVRPAAAKPSADPVQVYQQYVQCVREHGRPDYPDPVIGADGKPQMPDGVEKPSSDVIDACARILGGVAPSSKAGSHPDVAAMRRFAQCMRQHGVDDWPDPDAEGRFTFPPTLAGNMKSGPRWPQIQAAWTGPCRQYSPDGKVESTN
jgi:hypothetical protein